MKKFNSTRLAFTSAGCFLGAGHVSGQELWKFFGAFGLPGLAGRVISLIIQMVFVIILLRIGEKSGSVTLDRALIPEEKPHLHRAVGIFQLSFLFGVCVIMIAGAGALVAQLLGIKAFIGGIAFCIMIVLFACNGMDGLSRICTFLVPAMVAVTMTISVLAIAKAGFPAVLKMKNVNSSALLPNWWISALTYVSYNIVGAVGVIVPIGPNCENEKALKRGASLGILFLLMISACILPGLGVSPEAVSAELPMLALATGLSPVLGWIYAALLVIGMMSTSVSFLVAIDIYAEERKPALKNKRITIIVVLTALAFAGSLLGFGDLISLVYPIYGYLGFVVMFLLFRHWLKLRNSKGNAPETVV